MAKRGEIVGLPGWHYVVGAWRDSAGKIHSSRHAEHYLSGEAISLREAQQRAHGGQRYEKRVPPEKRKIYKRKLKNSRYTRYGPYYAPEDMLTASVPERKYVVLEVFGTSEEYPGSGLMAGKNQYFKFSTLGEFKDIKVAFREALDGKPRSPAAKTISQNFKKIREAKRYYILARD